MKSFETKLQEYAEIAVRVGLNVQKDQKVMVTAPIECAYFVRMVTKEAYKAGARDVQFRWLDDELSLIKFENAPQDSFKEYPQWVADGLETLAKEKTAFLTVFATDPELLKNVDPNRVADSNKASSIALKKYREMVMGGNNSWSIVSIPTESWAKKVFPEATTSDEAMEKMWDSIFNIVRIDKEDPVQAWRDHSENVKSKVDYLNNMKFKKFHYRAPGTDLMVEMPEKHLWMGAGDVTTDGIEFMPNMPTEEVFCLPHKFGVNGTLSSTLPLNYGGNLIEGFTLKFEEGKIVDFSAEKGYDTLKKLLETDEGASYLGEIALVPHDSPISNSKTIFFNTLFDENASCHFALGSAYPSCIEGGTEMTREELDKMGANDSLTHVDFMVGSDKLDIDAYTPDGQVISLFRNGNWAF